MMGAVLRATLLTLVVAAAACKSAPSTLLVDITVDSNDDDAFRLAPTPLQLTVFDAHGARLATKATWPAGAMQATFQIVLDHAFDARIVLGHRFVAAGAGPIAAMPGATTHVPLTLTHFSADADSDGIPDAIDNCRFVANADQASRAGAAGDACAGDATTTTSDPEAMTLGPGVSVALYRDLAGDVTYNPSDFSGPVTGGTFDDDNRPRTLAVMTGAFPNPWLATFAGRVLLELPPLPSQAAIAHDYSTVSAQHPYDPERLQPAAPPATAADRLLVAAGNLGTSAHEGIYEIAPDFSMARAPFDGLNNCNDVVADASGSFGAAINAPAGDLYFVDDNGVQHGTLGATVAETVLIGHGQPLTPAELVLDGATSWGIGARNDDASVVELGSATSVGPGLAPVDALYASFQAPMDQLTPLDPLRLPSGPLPAPGKLWLLRTADGAGMPTSEIVVFDGATRSVRVLAHGDDPNWRWIDAAVPPPGHSLLRAGSLFVLEWNLAAKTARVLAFTLP